jgi:TonB family protein
VSVTVSRSALVPESQPLVLPFIVAVFGHATLLGCFLGASSILDLIWPKPPPFKPPDHMEVAVLMPKAKNREDRATKLAREKGANVASKADKNPAEPEPIKQSDLSVPDPKKVEQKLDSKAEVKTDERAGDPNAAKKAAIQRALLQALAEDAVEGDKDQAATSKNGDASSNDLATAKANARTDPEWARYIQQLKKLFRAGFHPLPTTYEGGKISTTVHVEVDASGAVQSHSVLKSSGNDSYDAAAERAVDAVSMVPLPPEAFRALATEGYDVDFPSP